MLSTCLLDLNEREEALCFPRPLWCVPVNLLLHTAAEQGMLCVALPSFTVFQGFLAPVSSHTEVENAQGDNPYLCRLQSNPQREVQVAASC